jgi:hypothetical protein
MADEQGGLVEIIPLVDGYPTINLRAGGLPFKGMEFGGQQRLKTTWYVGNPVATQTVGGPTVLPTIMGGRWMDVDLGEGGARALVRQFEALRDRAIPLEVRWGGRNFEGRADDPAIIRRGKIAKFVPKYNTTWHVEWTCEFEWSSGDDLQTKAPLLSTAFAPSDDFSALSEQLQDTQDQTESFLDAFFAWQSAEAGALLTVSDALDAVQNSIIDALDVIDGASAMVSDAATGGGIPSQVADRVRGVCDHLVMVCQDGRAAVSDVAGLWTSGPLSGQAFVDAGQLFRQQAARAKLAMFPTDDPLQRLDGQISLYDLVLSWDLLAQRAFVTSSNLASQQVPDIIAIVRPPVGSDLRDLAVKYYGNADDWDVIADYNDLPDSEVPPNPTGPSDNGGPPIYIPRMPDQTIQPRQGGIA